MKYEVFCGNVSNGIGAIWKKVFTKYAEAKAYAKENKGRLYALRNSRVQYVRDFS